jgi:hypothetical protein
MASLTRKAVKIQMVITDTKAAMTSARWNPYVWPFMKADSWDGISHKQES